jgi:uncharacterized protein YqfB (UPF0267 family)
MFSSIPYQEIIPSAESLDEAVLDARQLLRISDVNETPLVAFRMDLDKKDRGPIVVKMDPRYQALVVTGVKTTTIRRETENLVPGPARLEFGIGRSMSATITAVTLTEAQSLTEQDAKRDGFSSRNDLWKALSEHYPGFKNTETVAIVEFRCRLQERSDL